MAMPAANLQAQAQANQGGGYPPPNNPQGMAGPGPGPGVNGGRPASSAPHGGFVASPLQKTMVAGIPPPQLLQQQQPPQSQPPGGGPAKTMMINPTDGVVSMTGGMRPGMGPGPGMMGAMGAVEPPRPAGGASAAYWAVCLFIGVAAGVGAYLIVRFV
jgi:hypothetical protein